MDIWDVSPFLLLRIMLLWIFMDISSGHVFLFFLGIYPGVELLGQMLTICFAFEELAESFPKRLHHFIFLPGVYEGSSFSTYSLTLAIICLFDSRHPSGCEVISHCGFDLNFTNFIEHLFICLLITSISSMKKGLLKSSIYFIIRFFVLQLLRYRCSFFFFFFTHTHCILFLQEINRLTPSIVHGWPQQK